MRMTSLSSLCLSGISIEFMPVNSNFTESVTKVWHCLHHRKERDGAKYVERSEDEKPQEWDFLFLLHMRTCRLGLYSLLVTAASLFSEVSYTVKSRFWTGSVLCCSSDSQLYLCLKLALGNLIKEFLECCRLVQLWISFMMFHFHDNSCIC